MPGLVQTQLELARDSADLGVGAPEYAATPGEDPLLAGYQDCAAEAVRFLVEEEGRAVDDPTVVGLTEHLQARSAYLEYLSLLRRLETDMEDQLGKLLRTGGHRSSPFPSPHQEEEEDGEEEEEQEDEEEASEAQPLLSEQQRHLVESVFRGCDLVLQRQEAVPPPAPGPPNQHPSRVHFHNNAYLDQVLSWAYSPSSDH